MADENYQLILGVLISIIGVILVIYAFLNLPKKEDNESLKSANIQLKILGIGLFIGGIVYAF